MSARTEPLKILIADDHAGMRGVIRRSCAALAAEFIECENGEDAVRAFTAAPQDWVIMDVQMPRMDGFAATADILRFKQDARVILISQFSEPEYAEHARQSGAICFIGKADLSGVAEVIRRQSGHRPEI